MADEKDRPGRAVVFLGEDAFERLLNLAPGQRVTGFTVDFTRLGILVAVESDQFPPRAAGTAAPELPLFPTILDTDLKVARLLGELADVRDERDRLRDEVDDLRRQLNTAHTDDAGTPWGQA